MFVYVGPLTSPLDIVLRNGFSSNVCLLGIDDRIFLATAAGIISYLALCGAYASFHDCPSYLKTFKVLGTEQRKASTIRLN